MPESFYGGTDTGRVRDNNEDAFIAQTTDEGRSVLAAVIDGVGGYEGGEIAAALAKDTLIAKLKKVSDPIQQLKEAFWTANERIYEHRLAHAETGNMACVLTAVLAQTDHNQFYYAHVGDTRLYLLRDDSLVKVSKDHSFVGFLEDNQKLSESEAMNHPKRNEINKALGFNPNMASVADYIETGSSPFLPGDLLMLCSDGLTDLIDNTGIKKILTSAHTLSEKTRLLIDAANNAGGKDNITVVLVFNAKKPAKQKATKPLIIKKNETEKHKDPVVVPGVTANAGKKTNYPALLLFLLCILLAAALAYVWYEANKEKSEKDTGKPVPAEEQSPSAKRFRDSIQAGSVVHLDSTFPSLIILADTISVVKDSLEIRGNNQTLFADSGFRGPLFLIHESCRYFLLQDMVLQGFDIGILTTGSILQLKNVRFVNCRIPVQYQFLLEDDVNWTGRIVDTVIFKQDTLQKRRP